MWVQHNMQRAWQEVKPACGEPVQQHARLHSLPHEVRQLWQLWRQQLRVAGAHAELKLASWQPDLGRIKKNELQHAFKQSQNSEFGCKYTY